MGITVPRATCHPCLRRGATSGLPAFLRVALLIAALVGAAFVALVYLAR
jgi:hypothetical protein